MQKWVLVTGTRILGALPPEGIKAVFMGYQFSDTEFVIEEEEWSHVGLWIPSSPCKVYSNKYFISK